MTERRRGAQAHPAGGRSARTERAVQPRAVGAPGTATVIPLGGDPPSQLRNPRFGATEYEHGAEVEMLVDAPGLDGRTVRFEVEAARGGEWEPVATATGTVRNGVAIALVPIEHPAARQKRDLLIPRSADPGPRTLRFHASLA